MSRPRKQTNRDLPTNLYRKRAGAVWYYQYRSPTTGRFSSLGKDKAKACQAARILNGRLPTTNDVESLVARVVAPRTTVAAYAERYRTVLLPARHNRHGRGLSSKTLSEYRQQLDRVVSGLGASDIRSVDREAISRFLEAFPPTFRNRMRSLLHGMFVHAVAEGLRNDNPVSGTLKSVEVVKRPRLTLEQFNETRAAAEPWFQRAMDVALRTLQRREDLAAMTNDQIVDGHLLVVQHKTGAHLRIRMDEALSSLLEARGSEYVIEKDGKRVSPDMLTKTFARTRSRELRATFHEIRALGARLMKDSGKDPQPLLGHADPQMTRQYLDRHEVRWVEVEL